MTPKERNIEDKADFQRACLEYRIRCARHVIRLAPLPEFHNAVLMLEHFRGGYIKREQLAKIYRDLNKGNELKMQYYGYTAVGEFYLNLLHILYSTLHPRDNISSSDCVRFSEARFCAASHISTIDDDLGGLAQRALTDEYGYQAKQYEELFNAYQARRDARQKEHLKAA